MKKLSSILACLMCCVLVLGLATVGVADSTEPTYARNEKGYPDLQGESFTVWEINYKSSVSNDYSDFECVKELERLFNCEINFIHPPSGQEKDNFAIMMASDELPDMLYSGSIDNYYPGGIQMAYADGILYDYTDLINEVNTPNFVDIVLNDDFLSKAVYDDQNRIIRLGAKLCGSETADFTFDGLTVREDILNETGLKVPGTIDEWYTMLTAMKANGVEYPLLVSKDRALNTFAVAYGILVDSGQNGYSIGADGQAIYGPYTDVYKDYLTEMNRWYSEELINLDYMNTDTNDAVAMLMNDRAGSADIHVWHWNYSYYPTIEVENPEKALVGAQRPRLNADDELTNLRSSGRSLGDYKYITVDAKNPKACVALLDALYLEDISTLMGFGIEGTGWEMRDGFPYSIIVPESEPLETQLKTAVTEWHTYEDWDATMILTQKYNLGGVPAAMELWRQCGTDGRLSNFILLNTDESEVRGKYNADIQTYVDEMKLKFITGAESLDNFEAYQEQLKNLGIEEMIAIYQSAQERYETR